jgi:fatty-acyl-CoA synthase
MSEAGSVFSMPVDVPQILARPASVGVETPGIYARVVDDKNCICIVGMPGELLLKGENVFSGYWRRPEENATCFTHDGWFRTGDIVTCDSDGFYSVVDRKKDIFISGGENVCPSELEAAMQGFPGIAEVAVFGVPDSRWGEVGHMAIVAAPGACIERLAVLNFLNGRIARYKLPKHISIVQALPRTGSGKVQKGVLRASLIDASAPQADADSPVP